MTEKGNRLCTFFFYPVMISLPHISMLCKKCIKLPDHPVINHFHIRAFCHLGISPFPAIHIFFMLCPVSRCHIPYIPYQILSVCHFCSRICPAQFRIFIQIQLCRKFPQPLQYFRIFSRRFQTGLCRIHRPAKGRLITTSHRKR